MSQEQKFNLRKGNEIIKNKTILIRKNSSQLKKVDVNSIKSSIIFTENTLYKSKKGDYLVGDAPVDVTIVDRFYLIAKFRLTVAKCIDFVNHRVIYEKTSEKISKLIGQDKYSTLLAALTTVTDTELKVRAIMSLLSDTKLIDKECQTDTRSAAKHFEDFASQTNETSMDWISKFKKRRRLKRTPGPYVVKEFPKKVIVDPYTLKATTQVIEDTTRCIEYREQTPELQELKQLELPDGSSCSDNLSLKTGFTDLVLHDTHNLLNTIAQRTVPEEKLNPMYIKMMDGSQIMVTVKPEDEHHIATPEILTNCTHDERRRLLWQQLYIDFKLCLTWDEDGNLPIHNAVMSKDVDWLLRQCIVLKKRQETLDIMAGNQTALQMSIIQETEQCTRVLLQQGADPCCTDDDYHRHCLHFAAEHAPEQLWLLVDHCARNARAILTDHEELWKPELAAKTDEELGKYLLKALCLMSDTQGYTPLMLASKIGNYTNVRILLEAAPDSVNHGMPTTGNTALFLAVEDACLDAANRGAIQKLSDHYHQTISFLLENGANPDVENHAGFNISLLLSEHNNTELSMLIANKSAAAKYFDGLPPSKYGDFMLLKDDDGNIETAEINIQEKGKVRAGVSKHPVNPKDAFILIKEGNRDDPVEPFTNTVDSKNTIVKDDVKATTAKAKPLILQNIPLGNVYLKNYKKDTKTLIESQSSTNFSKEFAKFATTTAKQSNVKGKNPALKTIINVGRGGKKITLKRKSVKDTEAGPSKKINEDN